MNKKIKIILGLIVLVLVVWGIYSTTKKSSELVSTEPIKIGVITALTGGLSFWGESTNLGVELIQKDLIEQGINVEFIVEDAQVDPKMALSAAQKLVSIDGVSAIYSEFNPAAIAVSSFVKDKDVLHIYNAGVISPLEESDNIYKVNLDYELSCQKVAQIIKGRGIDKIGVLKANLEFGELCLKGIKKVYGENVFTESYNPGLTDFRTLISKLKVEEVEAVFHVSFQPETLASLKSMNELGLDVTFATVAENISPDILDEYSSVLDGSIVFGLPVVSSKFEEKIKNKFPDKVIGEGQYQALASAYIHLGQVAKAFSKCDKDIDCVRKEMNNAKPESIMGFMGFEDNIAKFNLLVQEWKNGEFTDIKK